MRFACAIAAALAMSGMLSASPAPAAPTLESEMLAFANSATQAQLEQAIKMGWMTTGFTAYLVEREAQDVLVHRRGPDGLDGTADDNPFDTLRELYDTTSLGPESMEGVERYVRLQFPGGLSSPTLNLVNKKSTSANLLVKKVGLDAKTATNIWRTRKAGPNHILGDFDDKWMEFKLIFGETALYGFAGEMHVHSLDEVDGVGAPTIQKLSDYAALKGY